MASENSKKLDACNNNFLGKNLLETSPSRSNSSMSHIGFNSMHAASNKVNPMQDLSRMILKDRDGDMTPQPLKGKATDIQRTSVGSMKHKPNERSLDSQIHALIKSPKKSRPTSEERQMTRPTTSHFFTLENQEKRRRKHKAGKQITRRVADYHKLKDNAQPYQSFAEASMAYMQDD